MNINFNKDTNKFEICDTYGNYITEFYKGKYKRIIKILKEFNIKLPVEYNDFKLICQVLNIDIRVDVPYYFLNQHLIRQKIIDIVGIQHV